MIIGHVNLAHSFNGIGEHFIGLVESLHRRGIRQHVIVRNDALASRVRLYDSVTVGPPTSSPVVAYCLMPRVDVVHAHEYHGARCALLLKLTRGLPYVLTHREFDISQGNPLHQSMYRRAARVICTSRGAAETFAASWPETQIEAVSDIARSSSDDIELLAKRIAASHVRIYNDVVDVRSVPAMLL